MSGVEEYVGPESSEAPEIKKEREFIRNISDIRRELVMIDEILLEQERIMDSLIQPPSDQNWKDQNGHFAFTRLFQGLFLNGMGLLPALRYSWAPCVSRRLTERRYIAMSAKSMRSVYHEKISIDDI